MSAATPKYDVIIVGGGHNGLVAASYLAQAKRSVLVLERRSILGGACVTEEIHPGFRCSTTSYVCSLLRPEIIRDLRLAAWAPGAASSECAGQGAADAHGGTRDDGVQIGVHELGCDAGLLRAPAPLTEYRRSGPGYQRESALRCR